ncbi:MAG: hypothetical protein J6B07_04990 [Opitutales bacterium]|nr:hypothetical protein [Opitutales bacterium]
MKYVLNIIIFVMLSFVPLLAVQKKASVSQNDVDKEFVSHIIISRLDKNLDFLNKSVSKNMSLSSVTKIYKGEYFSVFSIFANVSGNGSVVYDIVVRAPSGNIISVKKGVSIETNKERNPSVVWSKEAEQLFFEDSSESGIYSVFVIAKDVRTGRTSCAEQYFELSEWDILESSPIADKNVFWQTLKNYHTGQSAEILYNLFCSEHAQMATKDELNHLLFMFFREAFRSKPFLIDVLEKKFDFADNYTRLNIISLFSSLAEDYRLRGKVMTNSEKELWQNMFKLQLSISSPYEVGSFSTVAADLLWGDFYAKGTYAPIERSMFYISDLDTAEKMVQHIKQGKSLADYNPDDLRTGVMFITCAYSLMRNTSAKLAMCYVDFYVSENKDKITAEKFKQTFKLVGEYLEARQPKKK